MTPQEFDRVFDTFHETAFRLETLPQYRDDDETEEFNLFLAGKPLPERSPATEPWLRRVADTTTAGKRWSRVHIVSPPLTDYLRFEMVGYEANVAAGEDVRIADRNRLSGIYLDRKLEPFQPFDMDFWLFDHQLGGASPFALLMDYGADGHLRDVQRTSDPAVIEQCRRERDLAWMAAVPLNKYMAALEA